MKALPRLTTSVLLLALLAGCDTARGSQDNEASESERIVELLELSPGMRVADVGAGDGEWTEPLAESVGPGGRVFATEVDEDDLAEMRERFEDLGLDQITSILGNDFDTGLEDGCCDAILLRLVYHHFTNPGAMRASLRNALDSDGLILVIDIVPQEHWRELEGVPDRGGHGIKPDELIDDMTSDGFEMVARYDDWGTDEDHYGVLFRVAPSSGAIGH